METPDALPTAEEIQQDLQTNPRYAAFFADKHPEWVAAFVLEYSYHKLRTLRDGDFATRQLAGRLTWFEDEAYERLWDIQQKKLFDLLCRWRADQIKVPGLGTTYDFWIESARIEACRVVGPITPEEVELYAAFLAQTDDYAEDVMRQETWVLSSEWQDYEAFREYEETEDLPDPLGEQMPAWYQFHNSRTGNGVLLTLPDVRGPMEERWMEAHYDAQDAQWVQAQAEQPEKPALPPDGRPRLLPFGDERQTVFRDFARQFESGAFHRQLVANLQLQTERRDDSDDGLNDTLDFLREITRDDDPLNPSVAMLPHPDWREGLRLTADRVRRDRVLAALPDAYEAYCQREALGIAHPDREKRNNLAKSYNTMVRKGREALGEAEETED